MVDNLRKFCMNTVFRKKSKKETLKLLSNDSDMYVPFSYFSLSKSRLFAMIGIYLRIGKLYS